MQDIRPRTEWVLGASSHVDESSSVSAERVRSSSSSTSPRLDASSTSTSSFWLDPRSAGSETSVSLEAQDDADARLEAQRRGDGRTSVGSQKLPRLLDFSLPVRLPVSLRYGWDQRSWSLVGDCDWVRVRFRMTHELAWADRPTHSGAGRIGAVLGTGASGVLDTSRRSHTAGALARADPGEADVTQSVITG